LNLAINISDMDKIEIKYRNGVPTKNSMNALIDAFGQRPFGVRTSLSYGRRNGYNALVWYNKYADDKMDAFKQYLTDKGIVFGKYSPLTILDTGSLEIKSKK
jgi:hypothetical protein